MPSKEELLKEAGSSSDPARAEALYKEILGTSCLRLSSRMSLNASAASPVSEHASTQAREAELRQQESALIKLGQLYRDQKCAPQRLH